MQYIDDQPNPNFLRSFYLFDYKYGFSEPGDITSGQLLIIDIDIFLDNYW